MTCAHSPPRRGGRPVTNSIACGTVKTRTSGSRCRVLGGGAREIRIRCAPGAFRVIYVVKFTEAVYVLHCFQKKTRKTTKADLDRAQERYRDAMKEASP